MSAELRVATREHLERQAVDLREPAIRTLKHEQKGNHAPPEPGGQPREGHTRRDGEDSGGSTSKLWPALQRPHAEIRSATEPYQGERRARADGRFAAARPNRRNPGPRQHVTIVTWTWSVYLRHCPSDCSRVLLTSRGVSARIVRPTGRCGTAHRGIRSVRDSTPRPGSGTRPPAMLLPRIAAAGSQGGQPNVPSSPLSKPMAISMSSSTWSVTVLRTRPTLADERYEQKNCSKH